MCESPLAVILCQVGHGALESSIVVGGHLVGNVVIPGIIVLIIGIRATNNSTIEDLWVSCWAVLLCITTWGCNGASAGASPVVGPEWGVDTKANHVTPASVSKDVTNLLLNEGIILSFLVPHVGQLQSKGSRGINSEGFEIKGRN